MDLFLGETMNIYGLRGWKQPKYEEPEIDEIVHGILSSQSYAHELPEGDTIDTKWVRKSRQLKNIAADLSVSEADPLDFLGLPDIPVECECGAKHTSNPNYHMNYCKMNK